MNSGNTREALNKHVDNEDQGGNETWHPWWERTWQRCWATINRTRPFWDIRMRMTVWNVRSPTIWGEDKAHSSSTGAAPTVWFSLKPSAAMWKQRITWPDKLSYQVNVGGWSSSTRAVSTVWFSPRTHRSHVDPKDQWSNDSLPHRSKAESNLYQQRTPWFRAPLVENSKRNSGRTNSFALRYRK